MNTDPQERLKGFDEFSRMKGISKFKDLKWQFWVRRTSAAARRTSPS